MFATHIVEHTLGRVQKKLCSYGFLFVDYISRWLWNTWTCIVIVQNTQEATMTIQIYYEMGFAWP